MGAVGLADHSARAAGPLPTRPFEHRLSARSVSCALPLCHLQTASIWHFASRALAYLSRPRPCATGVHAVPPLAAGGRATCASFCAYVAGTHGTVHSTPWQLPLLPAALQHSGSQRTIAVQRSQPPYTKVYHSFSPTLFTGVDRREMSQLPPPAYNPYAGESSISASAPPPPVYDAHAIPVAQVAPGPIYQQPPYPTQVARFHCLARSESGRRSTLENPASASVNLDCCPLVPTSALACPLPDHLAHLALSLFFVLQPQKTDECCPGAPLLFTLLSCTRSPRVLNCCHARPHQPRAGAAGRRVHSALLQPCTYIS